VINWLVALISGKAVKAGVETADAITAIPKNLVETEKARLEIENLKHDNAERDRLIAPPTYQQTLRHSNLYRRVSQRLRKDHEEDDIDPIERLLWVAIFAVIFFALFAKRFR
jgi:hypothetical protein